MLKKLEMLEKKLDELEQLFLKCGERQVLRYHLDHSRINETADNEIDIRELWNKLLNGRIVVIVTTLVFAIVSIIYSLSLPNVYKSEVLLIPAEEKSGGVLNGMAGSLSGLAGIAGVSLDGGRIDKSAIAIEVLKSREFIAKFVEKHDLFVVLMAAKGWDRESNKLILDENMYDIDNKIWTRKPDPPRKPKPSLLEVYEQFNKIFKVTQDKKTQFISISVEHFSPVIAKDLVDLLVEDINEEIKRRDVQEAKKSILYLTNQLQETSIADMQAVFYELIEEQTKTIMFSKVRDEYVFKTIDKAVVSEKKSKPNRAVLCVAGTVFGFLFGAFYVLASHYSKKKKP